MKRLHEWSLQWANSKRGAWALFVCAFADASFLPLPTPMLFVALVLLNYSMMLKYVLYGTLGSLFGALAGYAIGYFAWINPNGDFTWLARFVFEHVPGFSTSVYQTVQQYYAQWDFWILFVASLVPVPYKLFSISSGVFSINIVMFVLATFISQGVKFYLLGLLTIKLGPEVKKLFEIKLKPITIAVTASIALAFASIIYFY